MTPPDASPLDEDLRALREAIHQQMNCGGDEEKFYAAIADYDAAESRLRATVRALQQDKARYRSIRGVGGLGTLFLDGNKGDPAVYVTGWISCPDDPNDHGDSGASVDAAIDRRIAAALSPEDRNG